MTHADFQTLAALDAAGAASIDEERDLRAHLESCADCRRVRDDFAEAATMLARSLEPVPPPKDVRDRILHAVSQEEEEEVQDAPDVVRPSFRHWWLAAAATLFLALWGWREFGIRTWRQRHDDRIIDLQRLRDENDMLKTRNEKLVSELTALSSAETRTISLGGQEVSPSASAKVYLEPTRRRAVVFFYSLPVNPRDKSYQLWIIRADKPAPESAGTFDINSSGSATITVENLPVATEIKGLAVTMEKRGGAEQPSNARYFVAGNT